MRFARESHRVPESSGGCRSCRRLSHTPGARLRGGQHGLLLLRTPRGTVLNRTPKHVGLCMVLQAHASSPVPANGKPRVEGPIVAEARRVMEHLQRTPNSIPADHELYQIIAEDGWESEEIVPVLARQVDAFARVLACPYRAAGDFIISDPSTLAVTDRHIARCLITIRELLPGIDASALIRRKADLVLEVDAMQRARDAVCVISSKGLNPVELVNRRPLVLLRHDVWFSDTDSSCNWDESGAMEHDAP